MSITKKIFVGLMAIALCFSFSFAVAEDENDIRDEMAALEQLLADLAAQLGETTTTEETPATQVDERIPAGFTFDQNLKQGMSGENVMYLQILLNADADTRLAASGAGSPGNETTNFGPITAAAVKKFQTKYHSEILAPLNLTTATGYVGPSTRVKLDAILGSGVVGTTPTPTPTNEILEALSDLTDAVAALSARVDALDTAATGAEGTLKATTRADISNVDVYAEETEDVAKFRLEAEDSAVTVQRVDVTFDKSVAEMRAAFDSMSLWVDGEKVAETTIDRDTLATGATWVRFSGLNISIPKDGYKDVVVQVTASTSVATLTPVTLSLVADNAVRAVDAAGLTKYNTTLATRTFDRLGAVTGDLEIRRTTDSPAEAVVEVNATSETEVELLEFTMEAKDSNLELDKLVVLVAQGAHASTATDFVTDKINDLMLVVGDDTYYATNDGGEFEFDVSGYELDKGVTETFSVVAKVLGLDDTTDYDWQGVELTASVPMTKNTQVAYDINDAFVATDRAITGNTQHLYAIHPEITLHTGSASQVDSTSPKNVAIEFDVKAQGGEIWMPTVYGGAANTSMAIATITTGPLYVFDGFEDADGAVAVSRRSGGTVDTTNVAWAWATSGMTADITQWYVIADGDTARFRLTAGDTNLAAAAYAYVRQLVWFFDDGTAANNIQGVTWTGDFVEFLETNTL